MAKSVAQEFVKGLWNEVPPFRLVLGLCPTLAVTKSVENGIGMGLATTFVLVCSNILVSMMRKVIPPKVRIAAFIMASLHPGRRNAIGRSRGNRDRISLSPPRLGPRRPRWRWSPARPARRRTPRRVLPPYLYAIRPPIRLFLLSTT